MPVKDTRRQGAGRLNQALNNDGLEWRLSQASRIFLFLDYDGTLTPIVDDPAKATLSTKMRTLLLKISRDRVVTIVSGRMLQDIKAKVAIDDLYYAGSHGIEISGPDVNYTYQKAKEVLEPIGQLENELTYLTEKYQGCLLERKKFNLAIHFRKVDEDKISPLIQEVKQKVKLWDDLTVGMGKKVIEIKPDFHWHKGKAVNHLLDHFSIDPEHDLTIYIGDDLTDEDAFRQKQVDIGILVGDRLQTFATYHLRSVDETYAFLQSLLALQPNERRKHLANNLHGI